MSGSETTSEGRNQQVEQGNQTSGLQRKKALPVMWPEGRWPPGHMTAMPPRSPRFWTQPAYAKVLLSDSSSAGSEGSTKMGEIGAKKCGQEVSCSYLAIRTSCDAVWCPKIMTP